MKEVPESTSLIPPYYFYCNLVFLLSCPCKFMDVWSRCIPSRDLWKTVYTLSNFSSLTVDHSWHQEYKIIGSRWQKILPECFAIWSGVSGGLDQKQTPHNFSPLLWDRAGRLPPWWRGNSKGFAVGKLGLKLSSAVGYLRESWAYHCLCCKMRIPVLVRILQGLETL